MQSQNLFEQIGNRRGNPGVQISILTLPSTKFYAWSRAGSCDASITAVCKKLDSNMSCGKDDLILGLSQFSVFSGFLSLSTSTMPTALNLKIVHKLPTPVLENLQEESEESDSESDSRLSSNNSESAIASHKDEKRRTQKMPLQLMKRTAMRTWIIVKMSMF